MIDLIPLYSCWNDPSVLFTISQVYRKWTRTSSCFLFFYTIIQKILFLFRRYMCSLEGSRIPSECWGRLLNDGALWITEESKNTMGHITGHEMKWSLQVSSSSSSVKPRTGPCASLYTCISFFTFTARFIPTKTQYLSNTGDVTDTTWYLSLPRRRRVHMGMTSFSTPVCLSYKMGGRTRERINISM